MPSGTATPPLFETMLHIPGLPDWAVVMLGTVSMAVLITLAGLVIVSSGR